MDHMQHCFWNALHGPQRQDQQLQVSAVSIVSVLFGFLVVSSDLQGADVSHLNLTTPLPLYRSYSRFVNRASIDSTSRTCRQHFFSSHPTCSAYAPRGTPLHMWTPPLLLRVQGRILGLENVSGNVKTVFGLLIISLIDVHQIRSCKSGCCCL